MPEIETLGPGDLTAITKLVLNALEYDELPAEMLARKLFADPDFDSELTLGIRENGRLVSLAIGIMRKGVDEEAPTGRLRIIATHKSHLGKGLMRGLLSELEARLWRAGASQIDVGADGNSWIFPGVDVRYTPALCLFKRRGYVEGGITYHVGVDVPNGDYTTASDEARLRPLGFTFSRITESDRADLDDYLTNRWSAGWKYEGLQALEANPATGFIARKDEKIVGFSVYDIARPGYFGPIGTNEEERSSGIGSVLLRQCIREWQTEGRRFGEIAWIGPMYFYSKVVGAKVSRTFWKLRRERPNETAQ